MLQAAAAPGPGEGCHPAPMWLSPHGDRLLEVLLCDPGQALYPSQLCSYHTEFVQVKRGVRRRAPSTALELSRCFTKGSKHLARSW